MRLVYLGSREFLFPSKGIISRDLKVMVSEVGELVSRMLGVMECVVLYFKGWRFGMMVVE